MGRLFTSESVTEGHPDKIADQISDAVLDEMLRLDPYSRVACEVLAAKGFVVVAGEVTCNGYVDIRQVVRDVALGAGYTASEFGLDGEACAVLTSIVEQSPDIACGVGRGGDLDLGAGDQGMMFGYACLETPEYMPLPIMLAHGLTQQLAKARKAGVLPWLRPDGKSQVTVEYDGNLPVRVDTVVVSCQHSPEINLDDLRSAVTDRVILPVIEHRLIDHRTRFFINPTGRFVAGGPMADTGLTGRKNEVDTYGGMARHGGGAMSGKDPTKVDRTGAYAMRYIAKNLVAAGYGMRCETQVSYAIGVAEPVSLMVNTFGDSDDAVLARRVLELVDLRPGAIIERFNLRRPIYRPLAAYGHFGRLELDLPWERTDLIEHLC